MFADDAVLIMWEDDFERWREMWDKNGLKTSRTEMEFLEFSNKAMGVIVM